MLGLVSLCMDASSELIHSLLPVFLVGTLGASPAALGLIEGLAEAVAAFLKVFSGWFSDWIGKRKMLTLLGYGLAAASKPLFPLAETASMLLAARVIDRVGKGIRGAPRDAMIADIAPASLRGASFGLRQALDTAGAIIGPVLASLLLLLLADDIRGALWVAIIPAGLAVLILVVFVKEPVAGAGPTARKGSPVHLRQLKDLPQTFWILLAVAFVMTLARFSEAFLLLKADASGVPFTALPLILAGMNVSYVLAAYPAGVWSDRRSRLSMLRLGLIFLIAADLVLAMSTGLIGLTAGLLLWGLHMGFSQGIFAALVADYAPSHLRGSAFGIFNLGLGLAVFLANALAGVLWSTAGSAATFLVGAGFCLLSGIGLSFIRRPAPKEHQ